MSGSTLGPSGQTRKFSGEVTSLSSLEDPTCGDLYDGAAFLARLSHPDPVARVVRNSTTSDLISFTIYITMDQTDLPVQEKARYESEGEVCHGTEVAEPVDGGQVCREW